MIFPKEFKPKKIKKCDAFKSRAKIIKNRNKNLRFLLEKRFNWMSIFLKNKKNIIEVGSGNGSSKEIIKNKKIILTDIEKYPWISKKVDMEKLNLEKKYRNKVDVFITNHALHHCPNPAKTLKKMSIYLKKNGLILINEPEISFFLKFLQYFLDDESWSLKVNIFNWKKNIFKSKNPWASNTAIAYLLFKNESLFHHYFPEYKIIKNDLSEFFIFINSGGVNNDIIFIPLPKLFLKILNILDSILIYLFPSIFALNRSVILKKIK
tara:strand:+ start:14396 stop:15190 length:795 start_codon:yes stop_codon:yes gene_type:complete